MAIQKAFVVKNSLEVNQDLLMVDSETQRVGIGTTQPECKLEVSGNICFTDSYSTGISTVLGDLKVGSSGEAFVVDSLVNKVGIGTDSPSSELTVYGNELVTGVVTALSYYGDGSNLTGIITSLQINSNGSFLGFANVIDVSTNLGVLLSDSGIATITAAGGPNYLYTLRTSYNTTAIENQTGFTTSYSVGFIDVFVNGVRLDETEYTASDGNTITLNNPCFGGESVNIISYDPNPGGGGGGGGSSYWYQNLYGIYSLPGTKVGIGTSVPSETLTVKGDARITGILTVGTSSIILDGTSNNAYIGVGATIHGNTGEIYANAIYVEGNPVITLGNDGNLNTSAYITSPGFYGTFYGDGSNLTGIVGGSGAFSYCCTTNITSSGLTSHPDITTASDNFFAGTYAGYSIEDGSCNNFFGYCAGYYTTSGSYNNFFGLYSGGQNTTGCHNNFFGYCSGSNNSSGRFNVSIGEWTSGATTGCGNFLGGYSIGWCGMNDSSYNNFIGWYTAGYGDQGNSYCNNFMGYFAGACNYGSYNNNFVGSCSGYFNTGSENNFVGTCAGYCNSGSYNNFFGSNAGTYNTFGCFNTFLGTASGLSNTTGCSNTFVGLSAGYYHTVGNNNNFFGSSSGYYNTGCNNNFFGSSSGFNNRGGEFNNFFGTQSGTGNISGNHNTFIGNYTGLTTNTSYRILIGNASSYYFDAPNLEKDTQFAVGVRTDFADYPKYWLVGNENFNIGIGTTNPTSKLTVGGDVKVSGVVTASYFVGDGSGLTNLPVGNATYATTAGYASTAGIATVAQGLTGTPNITVGVATASSFIGNLTGTATTATNLADAANITTGTINSSRLSGTYNINVSYASTAGIATVAQGLTGTPNITVGVTTTTTLNVTGNTTIKDFTETRSTASIASNVLSLNAANGTVFAHTTSANIGIVSFSSIPTTSANCKTFTVLVTQGAVGYNTTAATGIGTQLATIVTDTNVAISTHIKVGSGTTITLTNSAGALDIVTFIVSYNGVGIASTNFTIVGFAATDFRGVI